MDIGNIYGYGGLGLSAPVQTQAVSPVAQSTAASSVVAVTGADSALSAAVRTLTPDELVIAEQRAIADLMNASEAKKVDQPCETCESRRYQDGSDDPGVSFKTPTKIDPGASAAAVLGHEGEHVVREQAKASQEGRKVVSQSVVLHGDICPECGRFYIAGGTTTTKTKADNSGGDNGLDGAAYGQFSGGNVGTLLNGEA